MAITLSQVNGFLDRLTRAYARLLAEGQTTFGVGPAGATDRAIGEIAQLIQDVLDTGDSDVILGHGLASALQRWRDWLTPQRLIDRGVFARLQMQIRDLGLPNVRTVEQFLSYYNYGTGGTNQALRHPHYRALSLHLQGTFCGPRNLYYEVLEGGAFGPDTFPHGLRRQVVGGSATAGFSISNLYAGGRPFVTMTGFAGSADTVTVTGTEYDPATGVRTSGKTWTVTVNADGAFLLAPGGSNPAATNSLICACSAVAVGSNITGGTIVVEARRPSYSLVVP